MAGNVDVRVGELHGLIDRAQAELDAAVQRVERLETRLVPLRERVGDWAGLQRQRAELLRHLEALKRQEAAMAAHSGTLARRAAVAREVDTARAAVEADRLRLEAEIRELERAAAARAAAIERRSALEGRRAGLATLEGQLEVLNERKRARTDEIKRLAAAQQQVVERGRASRQRLRMVEASVGHCDLCEQAMSPELRSDLLARYQIQINDLLSEHRANGAALKELRDRIAELDQAMRALDRQLQGERVAIRQEADRLERILADGESAGVRLQAALEELQLATSLLAAGGYAPDGLERLAAIDRELEAAGYDMAAYRATIDAIARLRPLVADWEGLERDYRELLALESDLATAEAEAAERGRVVRDLAEELEVLVSGRRIALTSSVAVETDEPLHDGPFLPR